MTVGSGWHDRIVVAPPGEPPSGHPGPAPDGACPQRRSRAGRSGAGSVLGRPSRAARAAQQRALARAGEDLAAAWYLANGYEVLGRNWSCREGELDIIARRGRLHVFCEVKARTTGAFGLPAEAVVPDKQARLRRLAARWLATERSAAGARNGPHAGQLGGPVRFDVACVLAGRLEVIEGAF